MAEHKKKQDHANQAQPPPAGTWIEKIGAVNSEHQKMLEWLKKVRFRKNLFGGVSEADIWRRLEELNRLYEASLIAERVRYEALLEAQVNSLSRDEPGDSDGPQKVQDNLNANQGNRKMVRGRPEAHQNHGNEPGGLTENTSEEFSEGSVENAQSEFFVDDDFKGV